MKTLRQRCWIVLAVFALRLTAAGQQTALDRYVHAPDPSYKFELVKTIPGEGYMAYVLDLTSQTWKTPVASDHEVWKHWLTVVRPSRTRVPWPRRWISAFGGDIRRGAISFENREQAGLCFFNSRNCRFSSNAGKVVQEFAQGSPV